MLDLMAVNRDGGPMPLYLHAVYRILREMRIEQQEKGIAFRYANFKERVAQAEMTPAQLSPLTQRLETLESFMPNTETGVMSKLQNSKITVQHGNDWTTKVRCVRCNIEPPRSDKFSRVASPLSISLVHVSRRRELALSSTCACPYSSSRT